MSETDKKPTDENPSLFTATHQLALAANTAAVTAIDILLEPDASMLQDAATNNARLLVVFPKGFALNATHRPHITLVQRFVRTADTRYMPPSARFSPMPM